MEIKPKHKETNREYADRKDYENREKRKAITAGDSEFEIITPKGK